MCVGFLSLSQEILWMRYVGFTGQGMPGAFCLVLTIYLLGIARGAMIGMDYCKKSPDRLYTVTGKMLQLGAVLDIVGPFIAGIPGLHFSVIFFIYLCSLLKSIAFPIAHHLGSSQTSGQVGKSISRVYFMNIIGSSMGPLVTGFFLVDYVSLQTAMMIMAVLSSLLGLACMARENKGLKLALSAGVVALFACSFLFPEHLTKELACYPSVKGDIHHIVETKSGIIYSGTAKEGGGDFIFGGNVYDGRSNTSPRVNSNILERVYMLSVVRPEAKKILVIGMSAGAWTRIITGFPGVKQIDVVEINPGYLKLAEDYKNIAPMLKDPRVHINIDDGRRWMKRHPEEKFDMIVMNTTFYWRNFSTYLLSQDLLKLAQQHLTPGGVIAYNTTDSPDVLKTAETVFKYAFGYMNFVFASDRDFRPLVKSGRKQLLAMKLDGKPVFDPANAKDKDFIDKVLSMPFKTYAEERPSLSRDGEVITDWNMITEFKHGMAAGLFCK